MAIRFVDKVGRLGRLQLRLEDALAEFQGEHVAPPTITGGISALAGPVDALFAGQSLGGINREGSLIATTDGASSLLVGTAVAPDQQWQLPAGFFVPAKQAMLRIYPRPNNETSSNARHRWAYYDGVNPIEYRIPVGVAFGALPYKFDLIAGPPGMNIGRVYGSPNYGVVTWVPQGNVTNANVTVRVTDQQGNTLDVSWTVSTSSATSRFVFVSPDGNNANSGSIDMPKQTLAGVFGSTFSASANAGAICYLRAGTYTMPMYTDNEISNSHPCFQLRIDRKPSAIIGYPGENVFLNSQSGRIVLGHSASDIFLQNLQFNGAMSVSNYRLIWTWASRTCIDRLIWTNASYGSSNNDNATMFFGSAGDVIPYTYINDCHESGRTAGGTNNYGFCSMYSRRYLLIERSSFTGATNGAFYLKGTNVDCTVRYCDINQLNRGDHIASEGFSPNGNPTRIEWAYNKIRGVDSESWHTFESPAASVWMYRNTYYRVVLRMRQPNAAGPYVSENNVIVSNTTPRVSSGSQVSNIGTECQGTVNSGIVDAGTLALAGSFRSAWLGRRGHEIVMPA